MATVIKPILLSVFLLLLLGAVKGKFTLQTSFAGYYQVNVNDRQMLGSSMAYVHVNDKFYHSDDFNHQGPITLILKNTKRDVLKDHMGSWNVIKYIYYADDTPFEFSIKTHETLPVAIFTQKYLVDVNITAITNNYTTISGFPNFDFPFSNEYGYVSLGGNFNGDTQKHYGMVDIRTAAIADGYSGTGPFAIFDKKENAVVISPFNNFLTASSYFWSYKYYLQGSLNYGIGKDVRFVPAGYEQSYVLYYSPSGVNQAFREWGAFLQNWYQKQPPTRPDITIESLGYWMDYGSYYYNNTPTGETYEDLIIAVHNTTLAPFKYIELDDWWYEKDDDGMLSWTPDPAALPHGFDSIKSVFKALKVGKWSPMTNYSTQNGGNYKFVTSTNTAIPTEKAFWDMIFLECQKTGVAMVVQDDLMEQMLMVPELRSSLSLGRDWLMAMAKSAYMHGIAIQYSSSWPSHALQSLELPGVTQVKVSNYYMKDKDQWKIGLTSMFAHAIGLAPSKDTFWTSFEEPGNKYSAKEPSPLRQGLIATLSTGAVGPGDGLNFIKYPMVLEMCCREDGVILKPDRPLTPSDSYLLKLTFNSSDMPDADFQSAYTEIDMLPFGIIVVTNTDEVDVKPSSVFNSNFPKNQRIWLFNDTKLYPFSEDKPFKLTDCAKSSPYYCLAYTSPTIKYHGVEINIQGEAGKWVPMSNQRVVNITFGADGVVVIVQGVPKYQGTFLYAINMESRQLTFTISASGFAVVRLDVTAPPTSPLPTSLPNTSPLMTSPNPYSSAQSLKSFISLLLATIVIKHVFH